MKKITKTKLKDAIYGLAVADALGVPYEFKHRHTFNCVDMVGYGTWQQPKGTWSDDTSLTLATCESIKRCGSVNLKDIMTNFYRWYNNEEFTAHNELFDIGNTTQRALATGKGVNEINANGNGSLMRIIPLAFVDNNLVKETSSLTHAHEISTKACEIYVDIAKKLINGEAIQDILQELDYEAPFNRLKNINLFNEDDINSSCYVVDTLESALWCLSTTNSYKECVLKAINLGGDTDTTGAVTGALGGIIYGYEAIPKEWIKALANKELIEDCLF